MFQDDVEDRLSKDPSHLEREILAQKPAPLWAIIDEVQKVPRLLDIVHRMIERKKIKFILSGSSARKLKFQGANLLAGRAFDYRLYPLTSHEMGKDFNLNVALEFGSLPAVWNFQEINDKKKFLRSYVLNYVKLEIQQEQLLRKIDPFRIFLEIATQMNGKMINASKISRQLGVEAKTVQTYFDILEDTYLGIRLPAFHQSLRKGQLLTPKFYFFDTGIKRALEGSLHSPLVPSTSGFGEAFEHWVILEAYRYNSYLDADYKLSYFSVKEGGEIYLILSRGKQKILCEIKSTVKVDPFEVEKLNRYAREFKCQAYYLGLDQYAQDVDLVQCRPWDLGLKEIFSLPVIT